jgi:hypothetical protein
MGDLTAAKTAVRAAMRKGTTGSRADERVDELLWEYQRALRRVHVQRLAAKIRADADQRGRNVRNAMYRAAALVEDTEADL